ncbi:MAG: TIM barrel protein [Steroidobacteraceae bacterium]
MIRLAANISTTFTELPFLERIEAAVQAGFRAVECQFPYVVEPFEMAQRLAANGMPLMLFNAPPGRFEAGERGLASLPGREQEFDASIGRALEYVAATGCKRVHVMAGMLPVGADHTKHIDQYIGSIVRAADRLAKVDATVMLEPINTKVDMPGYLLDSTRLALECISAATRPNIQLQYDVYHMQIMEGDLMRSVERLLPWIGHIQIADNPGRHEPGTGEIAFERLLRHIDAIGYKGHIGCEYLPAAGTLDGLGWAHPYLKGVNS